MWWTYRVLCDSIGRHSIHEVFYERDGRLISYDRQPVQVLSGSGKELKQLLQWLEAAWELPVLQIEELEATVIAQNSQESNRSYDRSQTVSLEQVIADLQLEKAETSTPLQDKTIV
jgi:hypothetical protein